MKGIINLKLCSYAFFVAMIFFLVGLYSYGFLVNFLIENSFYESAEKYWQFSLTNGFFLGLSGFLMVIYARLYGVPREGVKLRIILFLKMMFVSVFVYFMGLFLVWWTYSRAGLAGMHFNSDILVSVNDFNIYWSAIYLVSFWFFLLILLIVRRAYYK